MNKKLFTLLNIMLTISCLRIDAMRHQPKRSFSNTGTGAKRTAANAYEADLAQAIALSLQDQKMSNKETTQKATGVFIPRNPNGKQPAQPSAFANRRTVAPIAQQKKYNLTQPILVGHNNCKAIGLETRRGRNTIKQIRVTRQKEALCSLHALKNTNDILNVLDEAMGYDLNKKLNNQGEIDLFIGSSKAPGLWNNGNWLNDGQIIAIRDKYDLNKNIFVCHNPSLLGYEFDDVIPELLGNFKPELGIIEHDGHGGQGALNTWPHRAGIILGNMQQNSERSGSQGHWIGVVIQIHNYGQADECKEYIVTDSLNYPICNERGHITNPSINLLIAALETQAWEKPGTVSAVSPELEETAKSAQPARPAAPAQQSVDVVQHRNIDARLAELKTNIDQWFKQPNWKSQPLQTQFFETFNEIWQTAQIIHHHPKLLDETRNQLNTYHTNRAKKRNLLPGDQSNLNTVKPLVDSWK
jgi:hypothetical protein